MRCRKQIFLLALEGKPGRAQVITGDDRSGYHMWTRKKVILVFIIVPLNCSYVMLLQHREHILEKNIVFALFQLPL